MKKICAIIALVSLSVISTELVWTRIFSAEYFYTFAFLILSTAVLGLGLGALSVRLFNFLNKPASVLIVLILAGAAALAGPPLVIKMKIDFAQLFSGWEMILKLSAAILILGSSFYFGGIALAYFFKENNSRMPLIYMADLAGAGLGVLLIIISMNYFSTPVSVFIAPVPIFAAALFYAEKYFKIIPVFFIAAALFLSTTAENYLNSGKEERAPVIYTYWDAMSKIKVYEYDKDYRGINIDNAANSPVYAFDGNWDRPDSMKYEFGIDVSYLINKFDNCSFLSLGAGGGTDVLQALQSGASEIYAVEVNPHINYLLEEGNLAAFSGSIYKDPRVKVVTEDARTFVKRYENKFDVIYSLSSNTFAALASGSFALAENYLFTTEAFIDYWNSLSENGFMMMEHQFYMPRITAEFIEAMKELDIKDYKKHFAVYKLPKMRREILLFSKQPLNEEIISSAFGQIPPEAANFSYLQYPPADSNKSNIINRIVTNGWESVYEEAKIDISPSSDDKPFIAQMGKWKNFSVEGLTEVKPFEFNGYPLSKLILLTIAGIILIIVIPLNLLPYRKQGKKLKAASWFYFFIIGAAFMGVEVILIQKYSLFIGASVYSIAAVLISLLAGSALGSLDSIKHSEKTAFAGIILMLILNITLIPWIFEMLSGLEMSWRILTAIIFTLPLGFFMGMPFPKGAIKAGDLIDWGFAVNGAASVLGSVMILYFAFSFGFNASLILAGIFYAAAYVLLKMKWGHGSTEMLITEKEETIPETVLK